MLDLFCNIMSHLLIIGTFFSSCASVFLFIKNLFIGEFQNCIYLALALLALIGVLYLLSRIGVVDDEEESEMDE